MNTIGIKPGSIIKLKKVHPCGEDKWEVMRVGVDFKLRCLGCNRIVWVPRRKLDKKIKKILDKNDNE
ncbi:DUF951 domain-containing protein [Clostridium sp. D2Q-14]|uniref:DUF951 domain-containing protein n=1 Tax=Anaeromonas gelatinilytica TaxID=2683194 RepID=UPI00193AF542|nr:DUF951 domain-containing protein [Anaeromonas gelatinilytica]MBS4534408.1 DUF951 domain-containing protein [Anaeromonas gelatinilytica]